MNILIDQATAEVVHIDLGVAFEQGLMLKTPERVCFYVCRLSFYYLLCYLLFQSFTGQLSLNALSFFKLPGSIQADKGHY